MVIFEYDCPYCGETLKGGFGDNVYCKDCNKTFETESELIDSDECSYAAWLTSVEYDGKFDVDD